MKDTLLLFDIDGTLLKIPGIARDVYQKSIHDIFGNHVDLTHRDWLGKTDRSVICEILSEQELACSEEKINEVFEDFTRRMIPVLKKSTENLVIFEGVRETLQSLSNFPKGIVTGNIRKIADMKLQMARISGFFPSGVGAYGDEHFDRNRLAALAVERAEDYYGRQWKRIVIIGDSPRDIESAKVNGWISAAVATGMTGYDELCRFQPDYCFRSISGLTELLSGMSGLVF